MQHVHFVYIHVKLVIMGQEEVIVILVEEKIGYKMVIVIVIKELVTMKIQLTKYVKNVYFRVKLAYH